MWLLALGGLALAGEPVNAPIETRARGASDIVEPTTFAETDEVVFIGLFSLRGALNNIATTNPALDGQIVGTLGGLNGTGLLQPDEDTGVVTPGRYVEQRVNAFVTWQPAILDGHAELGAAFEIDLGWGDQSYATGGNVGGGFGADVVNLQTQRLFAGFHWDVAPGHHHHLVVGQQLLSDTAYDPSTSAPDDLLRTGGRLMFFGSEAAGLQLFGTVRDAWGTRLRYRAGLFTLVEQGFALDDDVSLAVADATLNVGYASNVGLHAWGVFDQSGGSNRILGAGPTSQLAELQGGVRLDLRDEGVTRPRTNTTSVTLALDGDYDHGLDHGDLGVTGLAFLQVGTIGGTAEDEDGNPVDLPTVQQLGFGAHGEVRWRWGTSDGSVLRLEGLYTSGGADVSNGTYGGLITGLSYGVAGAFQLTHGTRLLFPDAEAINRQVAVVYDISGQGRGVASVALNAGWDIVPSRLLVEGTVAHAATADDLSPWGTEVGGRVVVSPLLFLDLSASASVLLPGEAAMNLEGTPWVVYASASWLVF